MNFRLNSCGNNAGLYFHARLHLSQSFTSLIHLVCWFSFILLPSPLMLILNKSPHLPRLLGYSNHVVSTFPSPSHCLCVICFVLAELAQPLINYFNVTWLHFFCTVTLKVKQTRGSQFYGHCCGIILAQWWCWMFKELVSSAWKRFLGVPSPSRVRSTLKYQHFICTFSS